jgi:hypothetical protein
MYPSNVPYTNAPPTKLRIIAWTVMTYAWAITAIMANPLTTKMAVKK